MVRLCADCAAITLSAQPMNMLHASVFAGPGCDSAGKPC